MATEVLIQTDDVMDFSAVNAFRQDGHFCDTEIRTSDGERLAAHACVVAAGSPVLRHLLLKQSRLRRVLVVQGKDIRVCGAIWRIVLQVMYTGRAFVEIARLAELLLAAETLQIAQLRSLCVMLLDDINPDVDPSELPELLDVTNCNGGFDDSDTKCWTSLADGDLCREYTDETVFGELNGVKAVKLEPQTEGYDDALAPMCNDINREHEDQHDQKPVFDGHRFVFPTAVNGHVARRKGRHPQRRTSVETTALQNTLAPVRKQWNHRGAGDVPDMNGESSKRFPCDVCGRVFRYASNMNRHRRRDPACRRPSVTPTSALPSRKNRKGQFKCGVCAFVFTSRGSLRRHKRTHAVFTDAPGESNGIYTEIVKQELPTTTPDQNSALPDMDIKPWLYPVIKSETNAADDSLASLLFQPTIKPDAPRCVILVSDDDESKTYECTICGKSFNCSKNIRRHERTHLPREIRFAKRIQNAALAALNRKHREYCCSICGKSFPNGKNISRHKKTHHKVEVLPDPESTPVDTSIDYTCPTCGKAFPSRRNLRCHQARAHNAHARVKQEKLSPSDVKPLLDVASPSDSMPALDASTVADQSNTTLASDQSSDTPPAATVKQERTYSCSVCGRVFASGKNIRRHERSHRQEKRYRCETCGKHFAQSTTLVYHERIHTGEKPHMCRVCGNTYRFPTVLARHERTHNVDLQPAYECPLCGRGFSRRSGLDRHHCSAHDAKVEEEEEEEEFHGVDDTAADVMTAGFTAAEVTSEEGFPFVTTTGVTTADITNTTADVTNTTDAVITADFTTAGVTTADVISEDIITADFTTAGITMADVVTAEVTAAHVTTAEVVTKELMTADVITADVMTADITMAGVTMADVVTAEVTAAHVTTAGFITDGDL